MTGLFNRSRKNIFCFMLFLLYLYDCEYKSIQTSAGVPFLSLEKLFTSAKASVNNLSLEGNVGTSRLEARTSWILPFTAGTFLHIALVTVLPDLLKEEDPKESFKQLVALIIGIVIMAIVTTVFE